MTDEIVMEAIIYSAKHAGAFDERLEKLTRDGSVKRLYLDLPSLIEYLQENTPNE